jgi:hypothetical protein
VRLLISRLRVRPPRSAIPTDNLRSFLFCCVEIGQILEDLEVWGRDSSQVLFVLTIPYVWTMCVRCLFACSDWDGSLPGCQEYGCCSEWGDIYGTPLTDA